TAAAQRIASLEDSVGNRVFHHTHDNAGGRKTACHKYIQKSGALGIGNRRAFAGGAKQGHARAAIIETRAGMLQRAADIDLAICVEWRGERCRETETLLPGMIMCQDWLLPNLNFKLAHTNMLVKSQFVFSA